METQSEVRFGFMTVAQRDTIPFADFDLVCTDTTIKVHGIVLWQTTGMISDIVSHDHSCRSMNISFDSELVNEALGYLYALVFMKSPSFKDFPDLKKQPKLPIHLFDIFRALQADRFTVAIYYRESCGSRCELTGKTSTEIVKNNFEKISHFINNATTICPGSEFYTLMMEDALHALAYQITGGRLAAVCVGDFLKTTKITVDNVIKMVIMIVDDMKKTVDFRQPGILCLKTMSFRWIYNFIYLYCLVHQPDIVVIKEKLFPYIPMSGYLLHSSGIAFITKYEQLFNISKDEAFIMDAKSRLILANSFIIIPRKEVNSTLIEFAVAFQTNSQLPFSSSVTKVFRIPKEYYKELELSKYEGKQPTEDVEE